MNNKAVSLKPPKLSVCVITYNHEAYIAKCIESIVEQETDFEFELIVGDDCSTDATFKVLGEYKKKFKDLIEITLVQQPKNTGGSKNCIEVHSLARGEYIAHVDGDDYCLKGKLQSQVDILDRHPEVAMCAHLVCDAVTGKVRENAENLPARANIEQLVKLGTYFVHSSTMYRKSCSPQYNPSDMLIDFRYYLDRVQHGLIYLEKEVYGAYRSHGQGISRNPTARAISEKYYDEAYDYALSLGVNEAVVERARCISKRGFAYQRYLNRDYTGYKNSIALPKGRVQYASISHKVFSFFRKSPFLTSILFYIAKKLKQA